MDESTLNAHIDEILRLNQGLEGHLSPIEVRFIATLPFIRGAGELLEIGSYKGKSTIVLAKSAAKAGAGKVHACDPLVLTSSTDPKEAKGQSVERIFFENLEKNGVREMVDFHQTHSGELAKTWNKPLRCLWIDGDHTYAGALADLELFQRHLIPGAIVALHDTLHEFDGPARVFAEKMLLSERFGDCGVVGSISWSQYLGPRAPSQEQWRRKLALHRSVSRIIPHAVASANGVRPFGLGFKIARALVPHRSFDAHAWLERCSANAAGT